MDEYLIDLLHGAHAFVPFAESRRSMLAQSLTCRHIAVFFQAPVAPAAGTVHTPYASSLPQAGMHASTRCQW
jgi:hypothetical protein